MGRRRRRAGRPGAAAQSRPRRTPTGPRARWSTGRNSAIGIGIFGFALAVRVVYLLESADNPTFDVPISDAGTYDRIARSLAAGRPMGGDFFWQPVFYPAFLTAAHIASGSSLVFAKAIQALLGAVTCVLVYLLGRRVFDRRTGILAAFLAALYGPLIFFDGELLATGWAAFWAVGLILVFLRAEQRRKSSSYFAVGICGALAILTRPTFLLFFAAACSWLVLSQYRAGTEHRTAGRWLAALVAGFCLLVVPVAVQSQRVTGELGFLPASAWLNAHIGNNPEPCQTLGIRPGEEWDRLNLAPETSPASVVSADRRAWFRAKTLDYARSEPLSFLRGVADKSLQFVSSRELPRNLDLYCFRQWSGLLAVLTWKVGGFGFPFGVLAPLAVAGLILGWQRIPTPLLLFVVLHPLSIILVPTSRSSTACWERPEPAVGRSGKLRSTSPGPSRSIPPTSMHTTTWPWHSSNRAASTLPPGSPDSRWRFDPIPRRPTPTWPTPSRRWVGSRRPCPSTVGRWSSSPPSREPMPTWPTP